MSIIVQRKKSCTKCKMLKPLTSYSKHPRTKDGLGSWCVDCSAKRDRIMPVLVA